VGEPRLPTLSGKKTAKLAIIQKLDFNDLNPDSDSIGIKGSPTRVVTITKPSIQRKSQILTPKTEEEIEEAADKLIDFLAGKGLLQRNKKNAQ
ncbi:MAG: hypothetical protein J7L71_02180, partial [Spirochaetaceae bacterium]|nr:hypothetical protein [Spirochaetaceae bacterium]